MRYEDLAATEDADPRITIVHKTWAGGDPVLLVNDAEGDEFDYIDPIPPLVSFFGKR